MDGKFTVLVVNGDYLEVDETYTDTTFVRFNNLSWQDSLELVRLSFAQGFEVVIWKIDEECSDDE